MATSTVPSRGTAQIFRDPDWADRLVSDGAQTFLGAKTFGDIPVFISGILTAGISNTSFLVNSTTLVEAATYDIEITDAYVHVAYTTTGAVTSLTLPTAQLLDGRTIFIKDVDGNATANSITIDTEGAETIDGAATLVINVDYGYAEIYSDGTNWYTLGYRIA